MLQTPDVHTKRLLDLADFIEALPPEKFSMKSWGQFSEPRCICGWFLHNEGFFKKDEWQEAGDRLGLDRRVAADLFSAINDHWNTHTAAKVLRHLAITGELISY